MRDFKSLASLYDLYKNTSRGFKRDGPMQNWLWDSPFRGQCAPPACPRLAHSVFIWGVPATGLLHAGWCVAF